MFRGVPEYKQVKQVVVSSLGRVNGVFETSTGGVIAFKLDPKSDNEIKININAGHKVFSSLDDIRDYFFAEKIKVNIGQLINEQSVDTVVAVGELLNVENDIDVTLAKYR